MCKSDPTAQLRDDGKVFTRNSSAKHPSCRSPSPEDNEAGEDEFETFISESIPFAGNRLAKDFPCRSQSPKGAEAGEDEFETFISESTPFTFPGRFDKVSHQSFISLAQFPAIAMGFVLGYCLSYTPEQFGLFFCLAIFYLRDKVPRFIERYWRLIVLASGVLYFLFGHKLRWPRRILTSLL